jgi:ubiquinone biosynthesis monooxygenase Coq7
MREGEVRHLATVRRVMAERRVRPTALLPLWDAAGFALGAATALLGKEAAMACTVAVETVIGQHYNDQIRELLKRGYGEAEVTEMLRLHRDEEMGHLETGLKHDAEKAPLYTALTSVIKAGCSAAIWVAKRV